MLNLFIIMLTMLCTVLLVFMLSYIFEKGIFPYSDKIAIYITMKLKSKYVIILFEFIFTVVGLTVLYIYLQFIVQKKILPFYVILPCTMLILVISSIIFRFRKNNLNVSSLFTTLNGSLKKFMKKYPIRLFFSLLEQTMNSFSIMISQIITYTILLHLENDHIAYYVGIITMPIYVIIWVYYTLDVRPISIKLQEARISNIRRCLVYLLLVVYAMIESYEIFLHYICSKECFAETFVSITVLVVIALDRLMKAIINDYKLFNDEKG